MSTLHKSHQRCDQCRIRRLSTAVFMLVMNVGFHAINASPAAAECGDYLFGHMTQGQHHTFAIDGTLSPKESRHQIPCHGPSCRQAPAETPASSPVITLELPDRWGWLIIVQVPNSDESSYLSRSPERFLLPVVVDRLERPPKLEQVLAGLFPADIAI